MIRQKIKQRAIEYWQKAKRRGVFVIMILTSVFLLLTVFSVRNKSATADETWHLVSGMTLLRLKDLRTNTDHPYPPNAFAALPLAFDKKIRFIRKNDIRFRNAQPDLISEKVAQINGGIKSRGKYVMPADKLFRPRVVMASLAALFLFIYGLLIGKHIGPRVGVLAVIFLGFSPTFLTHSGLVTTDVPAAATTFLASFVLWLAYRAKTARKFVFLISVFAVAAFAALMSKYSSLLVAPFWLVLAGYGVFIRMPARRFITRVFAAGAVMLFILAFWTFALYAAYGFEVKTLQQSKYEDKDNIRDEKEMLKNEAGEKFVELYEKLPLPFPYYVRGVTFNMVFKNVIGHESFFLGKYENTGPWYYPVAFLVKENVAFVIASVLFVFWAGDRFFLLKKKRDLLVLWAPPLVIALVFTFSNVKIGIRHVLPVYPFLALGAAVFTDHLLKTKNGLVIAAAGIVSILFTAFTAYPHYLSYFNVFAGGSRNGYKWLQDSNYDWGQNEIFAKRLIEKFGKKVFYEEKEMPKPDSYHLLRLSEIYGRPRNRDEREIFLRELLEKGKLQIINQKIPTHWLVYYPPEEALAKK